MATAQEQPTSSPPTQWQRICRWLWRVMAILWGVIIAGIAFSTIANIFTTSTATPLSQLYVIHWITIYHIPLLFVAGGLLLLTVVSWIGSRERKASLVLSPEQQSRVHILTTLRKAYTDELAVSLQSLARIPLRLHERFDLMHPERWIIRKPRQAEQALPADTTIVDVYKDAGNGLLILGEPGGGKSILLCDLAQSLLSKAEQDESQPLPVILNLSSWATKRLPLDQWLVEELEGPHYSIQLSQRWLQQERPKLLPLLDGLDEVAPSAREACIEAINTYHSKHKVRLVVCCRLEEYQALSEQQRLTVQSVVAIQPLSSEQVNDYLARAGEGLAAVQTAMNTNHALQELLTTPLMLSVVALTYKGKTDKDLPQLGSPEEQQRQIFEHYVTRMLDPTEKPTRKWCYTPDSTQKWLIWLAQQLQKRSLTQFYIEQLQPDWLSNHWSRIAYRGIGGLLYGLVGSLSVGAVYGDFGWISGGLVGVLVAVRPGSKIIERSSLRVLDWSLKSVRKIVFITLSIGLGFWLFSLLLNGRSALVLLPDWLLLGLFISLVTGGIKIQKVPEQTLVKPNQGIWRAGRSGLLYGLILLLVLGVMVGLPPNVPLDGLRFGLLFGLPSGLLFGGSTFIRHFILRLCLWRSGVMPWHYVRFLEEAKDRILLRPVGGGYRFIHPLFQQYFASLNITPPTTGIQGPPSPHP